MRTHHELERTYAPGPGADLPDLTEVPGIESVGQTRVDELSARYFDTADLVLVRAGVSLRRRVGGADEGWHLKVPSGTGRDERRVPLARSVRQPPKVLRDLVQGWVRGAPLTVVATVDTRRTTYPLLGASGVVLAELVDDEVTGTRADGSVTSWREWEVELVEGEAGLLETADELMAGHGVEPAAVDRKVARVLGDQVPEPARLRKPKPRKPAARVVHARLAAQVEALARRDVQARLGESEGVHKARVACRRLRAALATFRPLLDRDVTDPLRDEIRWFARSLGEARDAKVVHRRLAELLETEPQGLVAGPVRRRLRTTYGGKQPLPEALLDPRYLALREALDNLVADPPWTERASEPARDVLPKRVRKEWKRLRARYGAVADAVDSDTVLHDVRKAAKRLRYAAETVEPAVGKDAKRLARAAKELTAHLGERQDTVASREHLEALARAALEAGEPTFTYGRLHAREEARAVELDAALPDKWRRLSGLARRWTC